MELPLEFSLVTICANVWVEIFAKDNAARRGVPWKSFLRSQAYLVPTGTLTPTPAVPPAARVPSFAATVVANVFTMMFK